MGIKTLLQNLTGKIKRLREYRGKRVAIDGSMLLYKGSYGCATELCLGDFTDKCVRFLQGHRPACLVWEPC